MKPFKGERRLEYCGHCRDMTTHRTEKTEKGWRLRCQKCLTGRNQTWCPACQETSYGPRCALCFGTSQIGPDGKRVIIRRREEIHDRKKKH